MLFSWCIWNRNRCVLTTVWITINLNSFLTFMPNCRMNDRPFGRVCSAGSIFMAWLYARDDLTSYYVFDHWWTNAITNRLNNCIDYGYRIYGVRFVWNHLCIFIVSVVKICWDTQQHFRYYLVTGRLKIRWLTRSGHSEKHCDDGHLLTPTIDLLCIRIEYSGDQFLSLMNINLMLMMLTQSMVLWWPAQLV